jgi:holo-[acyl-carrier protein] synthase
LNRIYTSNELEQSGRRPESLAVRFAAKEAVSKALGCGIGEVAFKDIEVLSDEHNAPVLRLHGAAERKAGELGLKTWSISLSHDLKQAIAMVVAIGD